MQNYEKKFIPLSSVIDSVEHSFRTFELEGFPDFSIRGVTLVEALELAQKYPEVLEIFGSVAGKESDSIPSPVEMAMKYPAAVFAWLAIAANEPGNDVLEKQISRTPDRFYIGMLAASIRQTIGEGNLDEYFLSLLAAFEKEGLIKQVKDKTPPTELSGESKENVLPEMFQQAITAAAQSSPTTAS